MSNYGEVAMDVNRDGWPDIVSGGWFDPKMCWYEHPGPDRLDQLWKEHVIGTGLNGTEAICSFDIDHDGRKDIMVNFYNQNMPATYFAYVGTDKSKSGFERRIVGHHGRGHGMGFGDLDGDGLGDLLTPDGWYKSPLKPKTQSWKFTKWSATFGAEHSGIPFAVDDLNLDGLADVIYGNGHDFGLYWLEQTRDSAGRVAWISHLIDDTYSQIHCPIMADLDSDGTRDLITGKRYRGHNGGDPGANEPLCIFWYQIEKGPDPLFTKHIVSYDENIGVGMNLTPIDVDNDGDLDIVAPGKTGVYYLENRTK